MDYSELTHENVGEYVNKLETMKTTIENLDKSQHLEILKILKKNPKIKLNENKSGVYVNLSFLGKESIQSIEQYLQYVNDQQLSIMEAEKQKEEFKQIFFDNKDNKDNEIYNISYA